MKTKTKIGWLLLMTGVTSLNAYASTAVDQLLQQYRQQGATHGNVVQGEGLWKSTAQGRSCTSCHGSSTKGNGKHVKTSKTIKPMAASINTSRYRDVKKVEKWFYRNCKWTLGRVCTAQEKSDILVWLNSQ